MIWYVLLPIILVIVVLNFVKPPLLVWVGVWFASIITFLNFGFTAPVPASIIKEYLAIVSIAMAIYVGSDQKRWQSVKDPIVRFLTEERYKTYLTILLTLLPLLFGVKVYFDSQIKIVPPGFGRSVHPAPPSSVDFKGKKIDLIKGENPLRALEKNDPQKFQEQLQAGRITYYQNCFFCHGDKMQGDGIFNYALDPIPTNFQDPATIGMLQEGFLFWRISKGGIGLPDEGGPWASAMPAWEDFLNEDQIWQVILYLYDYTGNRPRAVEHHGE